MLFCRFVVIEKNLYVVGWGLKMFVLNIEKIGIVSGGMLVVLIINGLLDFEDVVLSCYVIEL